MGDTVFYKFKVNAIAQSEHFIFVDFHFFSAPNMNAVSGTCFIFAIAGNFVVSDNASFGFFN